jgi:hypothetical protein
MVWIQTGELEFVKHNGRRSFWVWAETPSDPQTAWIWTSQIDGPSEPYASGRTATKRGAMLAAQRA